MKTKTYTNREKRKVFSRSKTKL